VQAENDDYRKEIKGTTAGSLSVTGLSNSVRSLLFIYDLGSEWKKITGLPLYLQHGSVINELPPGFVEQFNQANAFGLQHIDEIVNENPFDLFDLKKYYMLHLSYHLDEPKKRGMMKFLDQVPVL
jgi:chorismate dehydratase